uniref:Adaptor related protein complex 1 associated regulatory protein n=1 Tax=Neogobius melanostomus TaxID=47308 RepID=A0A8C6SE87_9GOBI
MGNCWAYCAGLFRREAGRLQRGAGSKYFRSSTVGEHYTIEFENLVESDEGGESPQPCPRPISDDEIKHLQDHHYAAISEKQLHIDQKLQHELEAQEEQLRQEEEARHEAQRQAAQAARAARERKAKEQQLAAQKSRGQADGSGAENKDQRKQNAGGDFEVYLQSVKAQSEAFRSNRLPSDPAAVTPNTELSWDFTTKTRSTNEDGSLDLEWEDEEGINRSLPPWERSRTEEDILRAALRPGSKPVSDESAGLEWEVDFISSADCVDLDSELEGFVNPVLDTPSDCEELDAHR